jgi:hypothetical protein
MHRPDKVMSVGLSIHRSENTLVNLRERNATGTLPVVMSQPIYHLPQGLPNGVRSSVLTATVDAGVGEQVQSWGRCKRATPWAMSRIGARGPAGMGIIPVGWGFATDFDSRRRLQPNDTRCTIPWYYDDMLSPAPDIHKSTSTWAYRVAFPVGW